MKIYNKEKTQILENPNLELGYLIKDKIFKQHHNAAEAVTGVSAFVKYEQLRAQGTDVEIILGVPFVVTNRNADGSFNSGYALHDTPAIKGVEAFDEFEDIQVYIPYTEQELKKIHDAQQVVGLKNWFDTTYTYQEQKYRRLVALGKLDDDGLPAQFKLNQLYESAEKFRARIQELEA